MENQQFQPDQTSNQPSALDNSIQNDPVYSNPIASTANPEVPQQPFQAPAPANSVPAYETGINQQAQPNPNLGMFGRRIGRSGFLLGCIYIILPLIIVVFLQIVGHFMLNSTAANSNIIAPSSNSLSPSDKSNTFSKTTVFNSSSANSDTASSLPQNSSNSYLKLTDILSIIVGAITLILFIPVSISLYVRRFHDLNQSGLLTFLTLIPFLGTLVFIYLLFAPGNTSQNKYGLPINSNNFWVVLGFKRPNIQ
ncbi:MAG TPA: DUF805 domain-containing protein [Candidatus Saccharimonadales bacterium]